MSKVITLNVVVYFEMEGIDRKEKLFCLYRPMAAAAFQEESHFKSESIKNTVWAVQRYRP